MGENPGTNPPWIQRDDLSFYSYETVVGWEKIMVVWGWWRWSWVGRSGGVLQPTCPGSQILTVLSLPNSAFRNIALIVWDWLRFPPWRSASTVIRAFPPGSGLDFCQHTTGREGHQEEGNVLSLDHGVGYTGSIQIVHLRFVHFTEFIWYFNFKMRG
jgi:hypothetical protein